MANPEFSQLEQELIEERQRSRELAETLQRERSRLRSILAPETASTAGEDNASVSPPTNHERRRRQRERVISIAAHDLRGSVTVLRGYTQLLSRWTDLPEPQRQRILKAIEDQTRHMEKRIIDLQSTARIAAGYFEMRRAPMDLAILLRKVVEQQRATANSHRLSLETPDRLVGNWDEERLTQALTNIISLAIRNSPKGAHVRLRAREQNQEILVSVSNQGVGYTPEAIARLFQPFLRAENAATLDDLGLELYITKGIVEAHGGQMWVESEGPNKGATFYFTLPRD